MGTDDSLSATIEQLSLGVRRCIARHHFCTTIQYCRNATGYFFTTKDKLCIREEILRICLNL